MISSLQQCGCVAGVIDALSPISLGVRPGSVVRARSSRSLESQMKTQEGTGCLINISSGASHPAGSPVPVSYGAAKVGLNQMTRSLAQEWGPRVRVNCSALGPTIAENFQSFVLSKDDPAGNECFANIPLRRGGKPAEVGRTCVFLASGAADFIIGTTIEIDGKSETYRAIEHPTICRGRICPPSGYVSVSRTPMCR